MIKKNCQYKILKKTVWIINTYANSLRPCCDISTVIVNDLSTITHNQDIFLISYTLTDVFSLLNYWATQSNIFLQGCLPVLSASISSALSPMWFPETCFNLRYIVEFVAFIFNSSWNPQYLPKSTPFSLVPSNASR